MSKNIILPYVVLSLGLLFLCGCAANMAAHPKYMAGSYMLDQKKYETAIDYFLDELSNNPDNWLAREKLGIAYYEIGQYDKAIPELERVLKDIPKKPRPSYYLGLAFLKTGQRSKAIETLRSYRNSRSPLTEKEIKKQITLLEISNGIQMARQAVAEEEKLKTLPPKAGTVAVFYFKDVSPDNRLRPFQKAMAKMIITDLSQISSLQVLERLRVQYLLREMELGVTGIVEEKSAPRYGRLLGARNLIVGTMTPGSLHVKTAVASTVDEDAVGIIAVGSEIDQFYILQKEIVYNILKVLDVKFTPTEKKIISQYHTKNLKAVVYFGQGLEALDVGAWKEAKGFFQQAVDEDPAFELAILYREATPNATAPSISALGAMNGTDLAGMVDTGVIGAAEGQTASDEGIAATHGAGTLDGVSQASDSEGSGAGAGAGGTGGVSVSW